MSCWSKMSCAPNHCICETQQRTYTLVTHRLTRLTRGEKTPACRVVKRHPSRSLFNTTRSNGHVNGGSLLAPANRGNLRYELNAAVMLQLIRAHHDPRPRFDSDMSQALSRNVKYTTVKGQRHRFEHDVSITIAPQGTHGVEVSNSNQGEGARSEPSHTQQ